MQYDSFLEVFDTVEMTNARPAHPMGELFTYHPSPKPEALHYHNFLELGYCEAGSGVFIVDGEIIPFSGRAASIIYEGQKHIAQSISPQKSLWHFLYIDIEKLFSGSGAIALEFSKNFHYRDFTFQNLLPAEDSPEIYELVRLILQETAADCPDVLLSLRGLVYSLLVKHSRLMVRKSHGKSDNYLQYLEDISPTLDYINMNFMEDIAIDTLLKISNASKASLQRKFLAVTGLSPIQYLHDLRIKRATVMLLNRKNSIVQISMEVGYNSLSSFNRMFLSNMGMSPSAWRKKMTQEYGYEEPDEPALSMVF